MAGETQSIDVTLPKGGFARTAAEAAVRDAGMPSLLSRLAPGPFGHTATGVAILESLVDAADIGLLAAATLEGTIMAELQQPGSFVVPDLSADHRRLIAAFQIVVTANEKELSGSIVKA